MTEEKYEDWDVNNLLGEQARDIVNDDTYRFKVIEEEIVDSSRWSLQYNNIFKDLKTGKCYQTYYERGATEYQDSQPFEYDKPDITEVHQVEKTIMVWVKVCEIN